MREIINNIPIGSKQVVHLQAKDNIQRPNWTKDNQEELFYAYFEPLYFCTEYLQLISEVNTYETLWLQTHNETSSNTL